MEEITLMGLVDKLESEADAYRFLEDLRWPNGEPVCPHCGNDAGNYFLTPADGKSRKTRTGSASQRRVWKCKACRKQFSAITDTVMHGTKIPVRKWIFVIYEMASSKNGISSREIERKYQLAPKTAWHMLHRIREAMKADAVVLPFAGQVIADETYIGGRIGNRKKADRNPRVIVAEEPTPIVPGEREKHHRGPRDGKTIVMSLLDETTGEVRSKVVPDVTGPTLRKAIAENVDLAATTLITDENLSYRLVATEMADHRTVNHSQDEYVRYDVDGIVSTNRLEGYFTQLKRSIDGTHHHVSVPHLPRYLAEFDYRYTTRNQTDSERMKGIMGRIGGRRLAYRPSQS